MVSLRGNLGRSEISLKIHVSNTLFLSSYNINEQMAITYYRLIEHHHAKAIEGYPSSLYNLALVLRDKGFECHIPIAFTSSETLHDYQRALIEKVLIHRFMIIMVPRSEASVWRNHLIMMDILKTLAMV